VSFNGEVLAYRFSSWDEQRLRMFAQSFLWRAAVTTNEIFAGVSLGSFASGPFDGSDPRGRSRKS
jgi:hypothetical protein